MENGGEKKYSGFLRALSIVDEDLARLALLHVSEALDKSSSGIAHVHLLGERLVAVGNEFRNCT